MVRPQVTDLRQLQNLAASVNCRFTGRMLSFARTKQTGALLQRSKMLLLHRLLTCHHAAASVAIRLHPVFLVPPGVLHHVIVCLLPLPRQAPLVSLNRPGAIHLAKDTFFEDKAILIFKPLN
jgi:hypothetical protein